MVPAFTARSLHAAYLHGRPGRRRGSRPKGDVERRQVARAAVDVLVELLLGHLLLGHDGGRGELTDDGVLVGIAGSNFGIVVLVVLHDLVKGGRGGLLGSGGRGRGRRCTVAPVLLRGEDGKGAELRALERRQDFGRVRRRLPQLFDDFEYLRVAGAGLGGGRGVAAVAALVSRRLLARHGVGAEAADAGRVQQRHEPIEAFFDVHVRHGGDVLGE
mmetsp:Transcript_27974/g.78374  ORF Transcript_27974/g.78374 Transcript_27974/m.78374 type:complete len:216 (+) Transcript_27974:174-821(+)